MRYSTTHPGLNTHYIPYSSSSDNSCFACHGSTEDAYITAGHRYQTFGDEINELRHLRICHNPECSLFKIPFNPTPPEVSPYKQFSLAVWRWIGEEYKLYNQNAEQIQSRIERKFSISISANTIRNYMKEIDVLMANEIDKRTAKLLAIQGIIVLALDGQKPDDNGRSLWLFVDLISNRVLKVVLLESADSETLYTLVESILQQFHVKLVGLVSDKQNNLVKLHDDHYQAIPHQYCHFHYLQNIWNHIEVKDCGLHQTIAQKVKQLYILKVSKQTKIKFDELGTLSIREVFKSVEKKLRRLIIKRNKKFEHLRGVETYDAVAKFVEEIDTQLIGVDSTRKGNELLLKMAEDLHLALTETKELYDSCKLLNAHFQKIRKWVGKRTLSKGTMLAAGDRITEALWESVKGHDNITSRDDLRSFLPHKNTSYEKIVQEMVRLYDSYRDGLFKYMDFPIPVPTNSNMEQCFGQEKGRIRQRSGKANVAMQVRLRGEFELKAIYAGKEEITEILIDLNPQFNEIELKAGLKTLADRTSIETESWGESNQDVDISEILGKINPTPNLNEDSTTKNNGKKQKED